MGDRRRLMGDPLYLGGVNGDQPIRSKTETHVTGKDR